MNIYGGGLVARTLKKFGVKHLFSLPGHQTLSIFDACLDEDIDLIITRHEASAVFMAQGLSFSTRQPGVVILAGGPELTNAITAISQAWYARTPLVIVAGANTLQKRDKGFPQDMDQLHFMRPITKWARSCHDVRRIPEYLATAYRMAIRGRPGPVYLEIPYDVMESKVDMGEVVIPPLPGLLRMCGERSALESLASQLKQARRPIAIAGSGVFWSQAESELLSLIRRTRIPLFLSNASLILPFPEEEVFGLGYTGVSRPVTEAVTEADLVMLLGTRMNFNLGFGMPPFISTSQRVVQIDIEPEEIDFNRVVDLGIVGDLQATLAEINKLDLELPPLESWRERLTQKEIKYQEDLKSTCQSSTVPIHPLRLVSDIETFRSENSTLILDGANSILWALMVAKTGSQKGVVISSMGELQAIGAGVPQALALKRAQPERQVILHTGDGSFGYGMIEMETAVRYNIPITVVIHNDRGWGMTRDMQMEFFGKGRAIGNQLGMVRYEKVVEALGGYGELVERAEDIKPALQRAAESGLPACVNVMVDPEPKSPGLMTFFMLEVMLGKQTINDKLPGWLRSLSSIGLEDAAARIILRYLDSRLHKGIKKQ